MAVPLPGHPDKPAVLVTRRIRALPSGEAAKTVTTDSNETIAYRMMPGRIGGESSAMH